MISHTITAKVVKILHMPTSLFFCSRGKLVVILHTELDCAEMQSNNFLSTVVHAGNNIPIASVVKRQRQKSSSSLCHIAVETLWNELSIRFRPSSTRGYCPAPGHHAVTSCLIIEWCVFLSLSRKLVLCYRDSRSAQREAAYSIWPALEIK